MMLRCEWCFLAHCNSALAAFFTVKHTWSHFILGVINDLKNKLLGGALSKDTNIYL